MLLSIVIPVYQAEHIVPELILRLKSAVTMITNSYEIVLVDDGSRDGSWPAIVTAGKIHPEISALKLSRNFGQQHAITAGLDHCNGDWVIVMDCDLQDRPEEISNLYNKALEGYDIVFARRSNRKDSFWTKSFSGIFYRLYSYLTGVKQDPAVANFGIYSRKVITIINNMKEPMRAFSSMARWVGFSKTSIEVEHGKREGSKSSNTTSKKINLALDMMLSYSDKPLKLIVSIGFIIAFAAFIAAINLLYRYFRGEIAVLGYTSIVISVWFLGGVIIFILGVIGLYIAKIFSGVKNRPLYIIDEKLNCK